MSEHLISRYFVVNVPTAAAGLIIGENSHRRYLRLSNTGTKAVNINFGQAANVSGDFAINTGQPSEEFTYATMGPTITNAIYAIANGGVSKLAIIEGFSIPDPGSGGVGQSQAPFGMA